MTTTSRRWTLSAALVGALAGAVVALTAARASAQRPAAGAAQAPSRDAVLITLFLRHDQSRPLGELNAQLDRTGWRQKFPPPGVEVVSWYVMMGIGQVVTVRVPPDKLREMNRIVEGSAWGAYRTEFYPTYEYPWEEQRRAAQQR